MKNIKKPISDRPEFSHKQMASQKEIYKDLSQFIAGSFGSEIKFQNKLYNRRIDNDTIETFCERFALSLPRYLFDKHFMQKQGEFTNQDGVDRMFTYRQIDLQYLPVDLIKSFDISWDIKNDVDYVATAKINNSVYTKTEQKTVNSKVDNKTDEMERTL